MKLDAFAMWMPTGSTMDEATARNIYTTMGRLSAIERIMTNTSSQHWSRRFEYPFAMMVPPTPTSRVLDVGGGIASFQYLLTTHAQEVWNLDPAARNESPHHPPNLHLVRGDVQAIPTPDASFDNIYCISTLEDVANWKKALTEMLRVLKPDGHLLMTFDVRIHPPRPTTQSSLSFSQAVQVCRRVGLKFIPAPTGAAMAVYHRTILAVLCMDVHKVR